MKTYPSISSIPCGSDEDIVAFDKLDGNNIRVEWSQKRGFYKFGTRTRLIDKTDKNLGLAVVLFKRQWAKVLPPIFLKQGWIGKNIRIICFFEFWGSGSFAGKHAYNEKDFHLTLIDVAIDGKGSNRGILDPLKFIKLFGHLETPNVLYKGKVSKDFQESVRNGSLPGISREGVVCKTYRVHKGNTPGPVMFKIKTESWIQELKERCGANTKLFENLV